MKTSEGDVDRFQVPIWIASTKEWCGSEEDVKIYINCMEITLSSNNLLYMIL